MSAQPANSANTGGLGCSGNSPTAVGCISNDKFIYDIPRIDTKRVAALLDQDGKWVGLALRQMGYGAEDVESIRRCCSRSGQSPSEQLLVKWGNLNHTITELFVVLSRENMLSAMDVIKRFVDPQFHVLMRKTAPIDDYKVMNGPPQANGNPGEEFTTDNNSENAQQQAKFVQKQVVAPPAAAPAAPFPGPAAAIPGIFQAGIMRSPSDNIAAVVGALPIFGYEELRNATGNWNPANELGKGGFGVVYKGYFKQTYVAIKKIKGISTESARTELRQSFNELKYLNSCRHENVVPLLGCSLDSGEACLVYQYMPGGSLDMKLFPKSSSVQPLSIADRIRIAKGTARGLQYLHTFTQKPIIHGDIKPGNILLDKNNEPKIGDFGLTRELAVSDSGMKVSRVYGTRPYIPPEFISQRHLSTKVDSFSYGLVLYEIVTGQRVFEDKRVPKHLKAVISQAIQSSIDPRCLIDPTLDRTDTTTIFQCTMLIKIGISCTADEPDNRKEMVEVYKDLEKFFDK